MCPERKHRLHWLINGTCPCINEVVEFFWNTAIRVNNSQELARRLYKHYPWIENEISYSAVHTIFLDMIDAEQI